MLQPLANFVLDCKSYLTIGYFSLIVHIARFKVLKDEEPLLMNEPGSAYDANHPLSLRKRARRKEMKRKETELAAKKESQKRRRSPAAEDEDLPRPSKKSNTRRKARSMPNSPEEVQRMLLLSPARLTPDESPPSNPDARETRKPLVPVVPQFKASGAEESPTKKASTETGIAPRYCEMRPRRYSGTDE